MHKEVLRLAALLACVALATSRIGLIGHELVGHGGVALATGAQVVDVQLFWFAGGWIRYQLAEPSIAIALAIAMAGIALELVVGLALWRLSRGESLGRRLVRGIGMVLVVHATWYLATGAWHGFGDGLLLYRELGDARAAVAIGAGLCTCLVSFLGAREVLGALGKTLPGSARARAIGTLIALVLAGGLHAGLAIGELALRRDEVYSQTMRPERDRLIAQDMKQWLRDQAQRGVEVTPDVRRNQQLRVARAHRTFPFVWLLAIATVASVIAGALRTKPTADQRISDRLLVIAAAVAAFAIGAVVMLDVILM